MLSSRRNSLVSKLNNVILIWYLSDVDECNAPGANNCSSNAECVNKRGSFQCNCKSGYTGDGVNCNGKRFLLLVISDSLLKVSFACDNLETEPRKRIDQR